MTTENSLLRIARAVGMAEFDDLAEMAARVELMASDRRDGTLRAGLRDILGHDITSSDSVLLDAAAHVKRERDDADQQLGETVEAIARLRVALGLNDRCSEAEVLRVATERADVTRSAAGEIDRLREGLGLADATSGAEVLVQAVDRLVDRADQHALLAALADLAHHLPAPWAVRGMRGMLGVSDGR